MENLPFSLYNSNDILKKDARNLLLESYNDGIIDDDEFILLYEGNFSKNPKFPYEDYERFDLDAMDDTECKAEFRFKKNKKRNSKTS